MTTRTLVALSVTLMLGTQAVAFFPPVPQPGEIITVVPPQPPDPIVVPPLPPVPPPIRPPVKPIEKPVTCTCPDRPQTVPEPATLIATASGLAALAGWRLRTRR
jgi:hypothetical protein